MPARRPRRPPGRACPAERVDDREDELLPRHYRRILRPAYFSPSRRLPPNSSTTKPGMARYMSGGRKMAMPAIRRRRRRRRSERGLVGFEPGSYARRAHQQPPRRATHSGPNTRPIHAARCRGAHRRTRACRARRRSGRTGSPPPRPIRPPVPARRGSPPNADEMRSRPARPRRRERRVTRATRGRCRRSRSRCRCARVRPRAAAAGRRIPVAEARPADLSVEEEAHGRLRGSVPCAA